MIRPPPRSTLFPYTTLFRSHTLTITVTAVGTTVANGTATASIASGPGSFVGSPTCSYTGGGATASCTVVITSATTGTTVVSATSSIPLTSDEQTTRLQSRTDLECRTLLETKADATIAITPAMATNAVGTNHTFFFNDTATTEIYTLALHDALPICGPGSFVGSPTCSYTGGGSTASCTVVITSATTGTTVVSATSSIPL